MSPWFELALLFCFFIACAVSALVFAAIHVL